MRHAVHWRNYHRVCTVSCRWACSLWGSRWHVSYWEQCGVVYGGDIRISEEVSRAIRLIKKHSFCTNSGRSQNHPSGISPNTQNRRDYEPINTQEPCENLDVWHHVLFDLEIWPPKHPGASVPSFRKEMFPFTFSLRNTSIILVQSEPPQTGCLSHLQATCLRCHSVVERVNQQYWNITGLGLL